jgi:hypothetical protein
MALATLLATGTANAQSLPGGGSGGGTNGGAGGTNGGGGGTNGGGGSCDGYVCNNATFCHLTYNTASGQPTTVELDPVGDIPNEYYGQVFVRNSVAKTLYGNSWFQGQEPPCNDLHTFKVYASCSEEIFYATDGTPAGGTDSVIETQKGRDGDSPDWTTNLYGTCKSM